MYTFSYCVGIIFILCFKLSTFISVLLFTYTILYTTGADSQIFGTDCIALIDYWICDRILENQLSMHIFQLALILL